MPCRSHTAPLRALQKKVQKRSNDGLSVRWGRGVVSWTDIKLWEECRGAFVTVVFSDWLFASRGLKSKLRCGSYALATKGLWRVCSAGLGPEDVVSAVGATGLIAKTHCYLVRATSWYTSCITFLKLYHETWSTLISLSRVCQLN